jgi:hypothetical protein
MITINEHNLDALLFDYLEGNLDGKTEAALQAYLAQHPNQAAELAAWQQTYVQAPAEVPPYAGIEQLVRPQPTGWWMGLNGVSLSVMGGILALTVSLLVWQPWKRAQIEKEVPVLVENQTEPEEVTEEPAAEEVPTDLVAEENLAPLEMNDRMEEKSAPKDQPRLASDSKPNTATKNKQLAPTKDLTPQAKSEEAPAVTVTPEPPATDNTSETLPMADDAATDPTPPVPDQPAVATPLDSGPTPPDPGTAPIVQRDYPEQQQNVKRGKQRRKKAKPPKKRVRVVPLNSDAF